jgi:8-oxo-dGTP pyrophosphatase MutT (NUDIX family)
MAFEPKKKVREGVVGIVFRKNGKEVEYLLLRRSKPWSGWETVKGGKREGTLEENMKRELLEETGLRSDNIEIIPGLKLKYEIPQGHRGIYKSQNMQCFSIQIEGNSPVIPDFREHDDYCWLSYKEAFHKLKHHNHMRILEKSRDFVLAHVK